MSLSDSSDKATKLSTNIESERKQFLTRGLSGIVNVGNTCYMNAALQCLSATQIFVAYFRGTGKGHGEYKKDLKHSTIRAIAEEKRKKSKDTEKEIVVKISDVKKRFRESLTYK